MFYYCQDLSEKLETWGYKTLICTDFKNVEEAFSKFEPHLVLLDISLPLYNGFYWCEKIRESSKVPIIFISSAGDSLNIVTTINQGGDDFLEKPFNLDVLVAKIKAQIRRSYDLQLSESIINYGEYTLDPSTLTFKSDKNKISLSKNEMKTLQVLISNRGRVISRNELMNELWDSDVFIDDNTLTVNINRLRNKLKSNNIEDIIKTKKGVGYYAE